MIDKSFQTSVSNQFKASRQIFNNSTAAKFFYGFFVGLPMLLVILNALQGESFSNLMFGMIPAWLFYIILLLYPFVFTPLTQFLQIKRAYKSNPSAQQKQNYEISGKGVRNYGAGFSVEMSWESIPKVILSKDFLLMYISKNCAYYLPKELVTEDEYNQIVEWKKLTKLST